MKKKFLALALVGVLVFSVGSVAFARGKMRGRGNYGGGFGFQMFGRGRIVELVTLYADQIGVTDEQLQKLEAAHDEFMKNKIELDAKFKLAQYEKQALLRNPSFDEAAVGKKIAELSDIWKAKEENQLKFIVKVRQILTPQQIEKIRVLLREEGRFAYGPPDQDREKGVMPERGRWQGGGHRGMAR